MKKADKKNLLIAGGVVAAVAAGYYLYQRNEAAKQADAVKAGADPRVLQALGIMQGAPAFHPAYVHPQQRAYARRY